MARLGRIDLFVLAGVSAASGVYFSGLATLEGSRTQIAPTVFGIVLGGLFFGLVSATLLGRRNPAYSAALGALCVVADALYVRTTPLVGAAGLVAIAFVSASPVVFAGAALAGSLSSRRLGRIVDGLFMGLGSATTILVSLVAYTLLAYSHLADILLAEYALCALYVFARFWLPKPRTSKVGGVCAALVFLALAGLVLPLVSPVVAAAGTATPIGHAIFIMMENHSFDNVFGVYPTDNSTHPSPLVEDLARPNNLLGFNAPSGLRAVPAGTYSPADPVEGYIAYHRDWAGGSLDGFEKYSGPQSMTYFNSSQMAIEWDLAMEYSLADNYFASALTETAPNRLYSLAGYSPVINDYGPPPYIPYSQSIFGELDRYGVSWGYYVMDPSKGVATLNYFWGLPRGHVGSWQRFLDQLGNGSLPAVCWVMPVDGGAEGYSQGPPQSVLVGELWLLYIVEKVEQSPLWNTTAVFITYDEGGGFYDHVAPPVLDGQLLGQRVPLIVVSPYAKENYVSHTLLTHTSLLAFVDYNWRLPALNRLVADSNIPLDVFDFSAPPRPPIDFVKLGLPVPPTIYASSYPKLQSVAQLFPVAPQLALDSLAYPKNGSSTTVLASLSAGIFVAENSAYVPVYDGLPFGAATYFAILALAHVGSKRRGAR